MTGFSAQYALSVSDSGPLLTVFVYYPPMIRMRPARTSIGARFPTKGLADLLE